MFPLSIFTFSFSRKSIIGAAVLFASLVLSGVFLYEVYAQPLPHGRSMNAVTSTPSGTVYLSPSAQAAAQTASVQKAPMLEMHIANNGLVFLRGAQVLAVSGSTIRVVMIWESRTFVWEVHTRYNTQFFASTGEKATLGDIHVGDTIAVTGMLGASDSSLGIDADYVRE